MDENSTVIADSIDAEQPESFDFDAAAADWNGTVAEPDKQDEADQPTPDTQDKPTSDEAPDTEDKPTDDKQSESEPEKPEADPPKAEPKKFTLKHLDEVRVVGEDEIVPLAQKGMDYDRQKAKVAEMQATIDRLSGYEAFLKDYADPQKLTVDQFIEDARATALAESLGIDKQEARQRIQTQREAQAKPTEAPPEKTPEQIIAERRDREVKEFIAEYGTVDPKSIPPEVWSAVNAGKPLLQAYQQHEKRQLQASLDKVTAELAALKKNEENKSKTTGSRSTAGATSALDPVMADWYGK